MEDWTSGVLFGIFIGAYIASMAFCIGTSESGNDDDLRINQDTANDLCIAVTGNETAIAKDYWDSNEEDNRIEKGQLVCELPSYDSTHNIVVRENN